MPEYTTPMFGQITETLSSMEESISNEEDFFSVAITMPFEAAMIEMMICRKFPTMVDRYNTDL